MNVRQIWRCVCGSAHRVGLVCKYTVQSTRGDSRIYFSSYRTRPVRDSSTRLAETQVVESTTQVEVLLEARLRLLEAELNLLEAEIWLLEAELRLLEAEPRLLEAELHFLEAEVRLLEAEVRLLKAGLHLIEVGLCLLEVWLRLL